MQVAARLSEQMRPAAIGGIVGQKAISLVLKRFSERPFASCWLFEGPPGVGKTSAAIALAEALNVDPDTDRVTVGCADLTLEVVKRVVRGMRCRPMFSQWRMLILEEFEQLTNLVQMALKVELDPVNLPRHSVVVATSNNSKKIQAAVKQRFQRLEFTGDKQFASAANRQIRRCWDETVGGVIPDDYEQWGWQDGSFSMRSAWDRMELELMLR